MSTFRSGGRIISRRAGGSRMWYRSESAIRAAALPRMGVLDKFSNQHDVKPRKTRQMQHVGGHGHLSVEVEPEMPAWTTIARGMYIKFFPRDPAMRSKSAGSWSDIGVWYNTLTTTSRNPTPAIQQKVAEFTAGMTDPVAKMKALAEYMQRQIRYVAIEIGIGGYQPHLASDIFAHQYGDCKDKATLLAAMLNEIGVQSYYVIIDTDRGIVRPELSFDALRSCDIGHPS